MLRYIKRAFLATIHLPVIGKVPLNLLFVALVFAAGFNREWRPVWLFGAWIELAYLWLLATNTRFQKAVDAEALAQEQSDPALQRRRLVGQLQPPAVERLRKLEATCQRALDTASRAGIENYALQTQRDGLDRLSWLYLKLLLARQVIDAQESGASGSQLRRQINQLKQETESAASPSVRDSKRETLRILERRLELLQRRSVVMEEIDADLNRIEAQAALALENASLGPQSEHFTAHITLTSAMLENDLFGAARAAVDSLDRTYADRADSTASKLTES